MSGKFKALTTAVLFPRNNKHQQACGQLARRGLAESNDWLMHPMWHWFSPVAAGLLHLENHWWPFCVKSQRGLRWQGPSQCRQQSGCVLHWNVDWVSKCLCWKENKKNDILSSLRIKKKNCYGCCSSPQVMKIHSPVLHSHITPLLAACRIQSLILVVFSSRSVHHSARITII